MQTAPQTDKTDSAAAVSAPALAPGEEILFSEVAEFLGLGQENIKDSLWFQAGQDFDSALVRLSSLESSDSLSPSVYSHIRSYRDSIQKLLIFTVAMSSQMSTPVPWTAQFNEEMEEVPDSSVRAVDSITHFIDPAKYSLPLTSPLDQRILQAMAVFMGPGKGYFGKWLNRKSRFEALVHQKLEARGMPKDLIYLAMVESGFNPKAWSKASASGIWQFISGTGRRYGLKDDWWYDPRRDPLMATDAALEYLADLHDEFQDWHQAMAAYNCGEGRVRRFRKQDSTMTYWNMPLPKETRFYVPKILAAMIIGHDPERYGFVVDKPEAAFAVDTATISHCLTIASIAKAAGISEDTVLALNPSLRRWCTPPNRNEHTLYLPPGTREVFWGAYEAMDKSSLVNWRHHIVGKGETISAIAARYRVSVAAIKATNKIKGSRLHRGQSVLIPLAPQDAGKYLEQDYAESPAKSSKFPGGVYRVKSGDNLFDIARRFGTTVSSLLAANNLKRGAVIHAGQRLKLSGKSASRPADEPESHREPRVVVESKRVRAKATTGKFGIHVVESGESIFSISRKLGVLQEDLTAWNDLNGSRIQVGQRLKYVAPGTGSESIAATTSGNDREQDSETDIQASAIEPVGVTKPSSATKPVAAAGFKGAGKAAPAPSGREERQYYIIRAGDTLWDISVRYRTTVQKLKDLNGNQASILRPGSRIRVK